MLRMRWRACLRLGSRGHGSAGSMACGQRSDPALGLPQISHTCRSKWLIYGVWFGVIVRLVSGSCVRIVLRRVRGVGIRMSW